jgi:hypothetical protein
LISGIDLLRDIHPGNPGPDKKEDDRGPIAHSYIFCRRRRLDFDLNHFLTKPFSKLNHPFLMTGETQMPRLTEKGQQKFIPAIFIKK